MDAAGVGLDIVYKFSKEEWKDDNYLNAFPFPFFASVLLSPSHVTASADWLLGFAPEILVAVTLDVVGEPPVS